MTSPVFEINCLGQKCPLPVTRLERAYRQGVRQVLLLADDPVSRIDIPVAVMRLGGRVTTDCDSLGTRFMIIFA